MKNINFRHPKYVLPLIVFPFLCLFFYSYKSFGGKKQEEADKMVQSNAAALNQINPTIPEPDQSVTSADLQDKMGAFKQAFNKQKDASAVRTLDTDDDNVNSLTSLYSDIEKRQIDSLNLTLRQREMDNARETDRNVTYRPGIANTRRNRPANHQVSDSDQRLASALKDLENSTRNPTREPEDDYAKQMRLFKEQMTFMDSIQEAKDPNYKPKKTVIVEPPVKPLPVKKAGISTMGRFNTISAMRPDYFIKAIIDENLKGYAGTGIRIRLLEDIQVGEHIIPKSNYLYGIISGFQLQRVEITIISIMLGQEILPVEIKIYDNDGMLGLYVPDSHFREFTKNLGASSSQGVSYQSDGESNKIVTGLVQKLFTSTTTAASQLIKKNKVSIKYNTVVYLVPKEEK